MNNILVVAKNLEKISKAEYEVNCPKCGEKQFALVDKLYAETYGKCIDCSTEEEVDKNSPNILKLL